MTNVVFFLMLCADARTAQSINALCAVDIVAGARVLVTSHHPLASSITAPVLHSMALPNAAAALDMLCLYAQV